MSFLIGGLIVLLLLALTKVSFALWDSFTEEEKKDVCEELKDNLYKHDN
jgi:hypothetical protein